MDSEDAYQLYSDYYDSNDDLSGSWYLWARWQALMNREPQWVDIPAAQLRFVQMGWNDCIASAFTDVKEGVRDLFDQNEEKEKIAYEMGWADAEDTSETHLGKGGVPK